MILSAGTMKNRSARVAVPILRALATGAADGEGSPQAFKFFLSEPGVYEVRYEELETAGLAGPVGSTSLGLTSV